MLRSIFLTFLLIALPISSNAGIAQVPVTSYTGLDFNINGLTAGGFPSACTQLKLDVTGAIANSGRFSVYGALNCSTIGSFNLIGSGYLSVTGNLEITANVANKSLVCTISSSTWSGSCGIVNNSNVSVGTATVTYLP